MDLMIFWLLCMLIVAAIAKARGRSFIAWCIITFIISPVLALILLLCLRNKKLDGRINVAIFNGEQRIRRHSL